MKQLTDTEYIRFLIAQGEHRQQDFKFEISDARKIAKTLSAFANTEGGRLLIGVKDNGKIAGVHSDEEQYMIDAAATLYCKPQPVCRMQSYPIEGKQVLVAEIEESSVKPVYALSETGKPLAYIRMADETVLATALHLCIWQQAASAEGELTEMGERENCLLNLIRTNPHLTLTRYSRLSGIPRRSVTQIIARLIRYGIIEQHYTGNGFTMEVR